jgi:hypothetical protein
VKEELEAPSKNEERRKDQWFWIKVRERLSVPFDVDG